MTPRPVPVPEPRLPSWLAHTVTRRPCTIRTRARRGWWRNTYKGEQR